MPNGRLLVRTFGKKEGICNACGEFGKLTEDHSPPKSCLKPNAVQIRHIVSALSDENIIEKGRVSQNGLKFRTLCHRCNNKMLGQQYDPVLAEFARSVTSILTSSLDLPRTIHVSTKPAYIVRAIFGHLAALGVERYKKGPDTEKLKDAFLDVSVQLPSNIRLYYWPFPYRGCVVLRDAVYIDIPSGKTPAIWLMKFFPVAFMLAWENTDIPMFNLPNFSRWQHADPELEVDVPIHLVNIPNRYWPETPSDEQKSAIVFGQEAIFSQRHK